MIGRSESCDPDDSTFDFLFLPTSSFLSFLLQHRQLEVQEGRTPYEPLRPPEGYTAKKVQDQSELLEGVIGSPGRPGPGTQFSSLLTPHACFQTVAGTLREPT